MLRARREEGVCWKTSRQFFPSFHKSASCHPYARRTSVSATPSGHVRSIPTRASHAHHRPFNTHTPQDPATNPQSHSSQSHADRRGGWTRRTNAAPQHHSIKASQHVCSRPQPARPAPHALTPHHSGRKAAACAALCCAVLYVVVHELCRGLRTA